MAGPEVYEYKKICPSCHREWTEVKLEPADREEKKKLCKDCKEGDSTKSDRDKTVSDLLNDEFSGDESNEVEVKDHGGFQQREKCGGCVFFEPIDDEMKIGKPWGHCKKGYSNPNCEKYTLTWAIDNLDDCPFDPEDIEYYGEEDLDLVHYFDVCNQFEEDD